jgi:hypothetical protein
MTGNKNKGMGKSNAQDMNQSDSGKMSREEAGRKGGQAQHDERGLEAADKATPRAGSPRRRQGQPWRRQDGFG